MILDLRTMGFLLVIIPFILGLIMLIYLSKRKVYAGFKNWVIASFCFTVGNLLVLMRGVIPDFISIVVGNCINVYGEILIYEGIQLFYGRPRFSLWNYILFGLYIVFQLYFTYPDPNINARIVVLSAVFFVLIMRSGIQLFRYTIPELRATSISAGYLYVATAIFPLLRGIHAAVQTQPLDLFGDAISSWFSLSLIASVIAWTFYFFFLNSARLELDLESARRDLELIAMTDSLTNSYNRRHFDQHAQREFQRAKRFSQNLSFLMVDIDHFKKINDTYGHDMGDKVLLFLVSILDSEVRSFDLVARYGGDEFIIMLLDTDARQAYSIADRIRAVVEQSPLVEDNTHLQISLSIGIAIVESEDTDVTVTLRRADTALYLAKKEGRNRVVLA